MADIFLSYRNLPDRRAIVARLAYILDAHKISVWWDYGLDAGDSYREQITREMASARIVVPLWCEESVASPWVLMEAELGKDKLFPARLQAVAPPTAFESIHAAHLENWDGDINSPALMDYLRRICVRLGKPDDLPGFVREQLAVLPRVQPLAMPRSQTPRTQVNAPPPTALWSPIEQSLDPRDYEDFLTHHPGAPQSTEARKRLRQLTDWAAVDSGSAKAVADFRASALEKSKLFPALDAHVVKVMRRASAAQRKRDSAGAAVTTSRLGWRTGTAVAGVLLLAAGASAVWLDPFDWRRDEMVVIEEAAPAAWPVDSAETGPASAPTLAPMEYTGDATEAAPAEGALAVPADGAAVQKEVFDRAAAEQAARELASKEAADRAEQEYRAREARERADRSQEQQRIADQADDDAWRIARTSGTISGLQAYLDRYPYGRNASAARTEKTRLTAFNVDLLNAQVRTAALSAREAQRQAVSAAAEARKVAAKADEIVLAARAAGSGTVVESTSDDIYESQQVSGQRSGYGIRWTTGGNYKGHEYRGQWAAGNYSGYGASYFANAASAASASHEGTFVAGRYAGPGVHTWKSGHRFEGNFKDDSPSGYGVMFFPVGWRYEGEWINGKRTGLGVEWDSTGNVTNSGRWKDDVLVEWLSK